MRAQRQVIARQVAERLFAAEAALDVAAARLAELTAALPLARLEARLSATIGQDAFRNSASAMMLIAKTREKIVMMHAFLKQASDDIGLRELNYGDLLKAPSAQVAPVGRHLRLA